MIRRWTSLTAFLSVLCNVGIRAQAPDNMIYNPSFEEHRRCPEKIDALGVMTSVDAWWQPTKGSSDYFNACGSRDCNVPRNKMGNQEAHNGVAYCGIYCSQENYREYLQTELKEPLQAGQRYRISFWVSLADKSPHAVASIGALFTEHMIADTSSWDILMERETTDYEQQQSMSIASYLHPQVANNHDSVLLDSKTWHEISGEFVARGGERFLTIGNFADFNHSNVTPTNNSNAILQGAYYYIDDISVTPVDSAITERKQIPPAIPAVGEVTTIHGIYFATGKSEILPQSYNALQRLLQILNANPDMRIELRGHTDNQGTADFNMRLSQARADAVAQYLIECGINAKRISTQGFGKTMPIDTNDTPQGRSNNRRVEYRIME